MTQKRKTARRNPFVTTVSVATASAGWLAACGGSVDVPSITNPPPPLTCPTDEPTSGATCPTFEPTVDGTELFCLYPGAAGCSSQFRCEPGGVWQNVSPTCNPPPPLTCPTDVPVGGVPCPPFGPLDGATLVCSYMTSSSCPKEYTCTPNGSWQNTGSSCNPPPCELANGEAECVAEPGCTWDGMACVPSA